MKKYKKYAKISVEKELQNIYCNSCGNIFSGDFIQNIKLSNGLFSISKYNCKTEIDVCEKCLNSWVSSFKIKPEDPHIFKEGYGKSIAIDAHTGAYMIVEHNYVGPEDTSEEEFVKWTIQHDKISYRENDTFFHNWLEESSSIKRLEGGTVYRHYKGQDYLILEGFLVNIKTYVPMVMYQALYGENKIFVRNLESFVEEVDSKEFNHKGPRFKILEV